LSDIRGHSGIKEPEDEPILVPFLKWAGGKRWLISDYPSLLEKTYGRYVEPFLGSGAVFFHLKPRKALLADINNDLIDCYIAIKDRWEDVLRILRRHHRQHSRGHYYLERGRNRRTLVERAARLIYLNRTCWNGLYRVNLNGDFNVPIGTKTSVLLDTDNFSEISDLLSTTKLQCQDFEVTIDATIEGDFIFADPPYTVKHNHNGFLKYNESIFSWDDQRRLHSALIERSCEALVSFC